MKHLIILPLMYSSVSFAAQPRTLHMSEGRLESISVVPGRSTILSFPSKPSKVILGNAGLFAVEYVENDLAIAATRSTASSNLFVYLEGRRYGFHLSTASGRGDDVVFVRDEKGKKLKVRLKNE